MNPMPPSRPTPPMAGGPQQGMAVQMPGMEPEGDEAGMGGIEELLQALAAQGVQIQPGPSGTLILTMPGQAGPAGGAAMGGAPPPV